MHPSWYKKNEIKRSAETDVKNTGKSMRGSRGKELLQLNDTDEKN